jgi:hypothetical protein
MRHCRTALYAACDFLNVSSESDEPVASGASERNELAITSHLETRLPITPDKLIIATIVRAHRSRYQ